MEQENEIRTARLTLRPLAAPDLPAVASLLNDLDVSRWLTVVPYPYSLADARAFLHWLADKPALEALAIHAPEGLVGVVGVGETLGYWLGRAHHGKGYMTEAAGAVVAAHFRSTGAERLGSGYFEGNAASAAVLTKLGFAPDGETKVNSRAQGLDVTMKKVVLRRKDWEARLAP